MHDPKYTAAVGALCGIVLVGLALTGNPVAVLMGALPAVVFVFGLVGEVIERRDQPERL